MGAYSPSYSRTFTNTEILAMAGYQLDPGHSDLDNEQPMSVRVHDGLWDHVDLRCLLGDIRKAKADFYAGLRRDLLASVLLEALKGLLPEDWADDDTMDHMPGVRQARVAIAMAEGR